MRVFETRIPGTGRRYTIRFENGGELVVLVRNGGSREVFWRESADEDSGRLFGTTESQARRLADIFDGTYFEPVGEEFEDALENARIRWVEVPAASSFAGATIREREVRTRTGVTVLAIQRGEETVPNPGPDTRIEAGDILVAVGTETAHDALEAALRQ